MAFIITRIGFKGAALSVAEPTAQAALDHVLELQRTGHQFITIRDEAGQSVTVDELASSRTRGSI
jgi:hypothetical protein